MGGTHQARCKGQPDSEIYNLFATLNQEQQKDKHDIYSLYEGRLRSHAQNFESMKRKWEGFTGVPVPTKKLRTLEPEVALAEYESVVITNQQPSAAAELNQKPAAKKAAKVPAMKPHPDDKLNVDQMKVNDLRLALKKKKLATGGRKAELQARLREYLAEAMKEREAKWAAKYAAKETETTRIKQVRIGGNTGNVQEKVKDVVMEDAGEAASSAPVVKNATSKFKDVAMESEKETKKQAPKSALKPSKYTSSNVEDAKPASKPVPASLAKEDLPAPKQILATKVSESSLESSNLPCVSNSVAEGSKLQSNVQKMKAPSALAQTKVGGSSFKTPGGSGSATAKLLEKKKAHAAATEARKARMAEMRQKAKPTPGSASSAAKHPSSHSKYVASSALKKMASNPALGECKSNSILAKMRVKAAAEKNTENAAPTKPTDTVKHNQGGLAKSSSAVKRVSPVKQTSQSALNPMALKSIHDPANKPSPVPETKKPIAKPVEKPLSPMQTYEMSDREEDSDSESDSDEEYERQRPKKAVPLWAQKANLHRALERQFADTAERLDPDKIFGEVVTCNLEEIFDKKKSRYQRRTSSGNWGKDHVTLAEKLTYKRTMGYD